MFRVPAYLLAVGIHFALMNDISSAAAPSLHDSGRSDTPPRISIFGCNEEPVGILRCTSLGVEYVSWPDEFYQHEGTWFTYSDDAYFAEHFERRLLICAIHPDAYQISPKGMRVVLSEDLDVETCYQEAYRVPYDAGIYESLDSFAGIVKVRVLLEQPASLLVQMDNGTESFGTFSAQYSCKTEIAARFQKVSVSLDAPGRPIAESTSTEDSACNTNLFVREQD